MARVAIALQGSFGHEIYALGIMSGFQEEGVKLVAGSGTVEMLLPILLFFNKNSDQNIHKPTDPYKTYIEEYFEKEIRNPFTIKQKLPRFLPKWSPVEYYYQLMNSYMKNPTSPMILFHFIPNGFFEFSGFFKEFMRQPLTDLFNDSSKPIFTNLLDANDLEEIYLYCGALTEKEIEFIKENPQKRGNKRGKQTGKPKKRMMKLDVEHFFASGARIPFFSPVRINEKYYIEGALRCNPPLNPFMDLASKPDTILLIRFFQKNKNKKIETGAELWDRYFEVNFNAPLEKEIQTIKTINTIIQQNSNIKGYRYITILDPANEPEDKTYSGKGNDCFKELIQGLDFFSHFEEINPLNHKDMFDDGVNVGKQLANYYSKRNWQP